MNASISFLPPAASPSASEAIAITPAAEKNSADAPFSRMLDRAVQEAPSRKGKPLQSERQTAAKSGTNSSKQSDQSDQAKTELENAPRPTPRLKNKKSDRDEQESLAGACSVTAPATPPEEPVAPVTTEGSTDALTAVTDQNSGETTDASTTEPVLATKVETATSRESNLATLIAPAEKVTTEAEGQSLVSALTPTALPETPTTKLSLPKTPTPKLADVPGVAISEVTASDATASATSATEQNQSLITAAENKVPRAGAPSDFTTDNVSSEAAEIAATTVASAAEAQDSAPEEVRRSVRAVRRARLEALENPTGIGGAKSNETMKTVIKKEELAGGTEQFLPVSSPNALSALRNLPGELNRKAAGQISATDALDAAAKTMAAPAHSAVSTESDALFIRPNSPMARISEVVSREVRMFKRGGDDLVEVVLTPDTKTQISLRLQWREGQVEVQARCDLGDYQSLNTQWSQLQASLAGHGVRLSHLSERVTTGFTEFFNNPNFAQQRGREEQSQNPAGGNESLPALPTTPVKPGATPMVRRSNRLFDSWA